MFYFIILVCCVMPHDHDPLDPAHSFRSSGMSYHDLVLSITTERRSSPVVGRSLSTSVARVQFPGWEARIIWCKNLALYIRDCESLCLSDETLKAVGPSYLVSMPRGSKRSHTGGKCVTCRGLHILT